MNGERLDLEAPATLAPPLPAAAEVAWPIADRSERIANACIAVATAGVLALALTLTPSAAGHGTHQQLGLPPCNFLVFTGVPCLSCGMTTSFAHVVRGHLLDGFAAQPFGAFLALCAMVALPLCAWSAWRGRSLTVPLGALNWRLWGPLLLVFLLSAWAYKIVQVRMGAG